jgi:hypothetical protein
VLFWKLYFRRLVEFHPSQAYINVRTGQTTT